MSRRVRIVIRGAVQGVGFRPFIYRLATGMGLGGWVLNSAQGVFIEAEGAKDALDTLILRIEREKPPRSFIQSMEFSFLDPVHFRGFEIRHSDDAGSKTVLVLPDIATCADCRREVFDPRNRRYRYPFTNCTNCGPRFSIIEALPYDRKNTTMKRFRMCAQCQSEYDDPMDRRFHAQPNACSRCGPRLELWNRSGAVMHRDHDALLQAAEEIRQGRILAVKGLGGFHLVVDARNEDAVCRLRKRKHREQKPLALMVPDLDSVRAECEISELEERLLCSPESPIVLLRRRIDGAGRVAPSVAPRNPFLGMMIPYTPLHHLLMAHLSFPVVATSGNLSDEPICTDEREAVQRLDAIVDLFLVHNRPIVRHVDDSIARVIMGRELVLRRARGYAPLPVSLAQPAPPALAVGGHLKNTVAVALDRNVFISQHIGDLETNQAYEAFRKVVKNLKDLYEIVPQHIICDLHPDYLSSQYARADGAPYRGVQHHYAHLASCMAENHLEGPVLGVAWDGSGYGTDGTLWGGEFLLALGDTYRRVASLRPFRLPGSSRAVREPRRTAVGLLYEIFGPSLFERDDLAPLKAFTPSERRLLGQMLAKDVQSPWTSSAGRLFDAVCSVAGLCQRASFEGQAAMELEFAIEDTGTDHHYAWRILSDPSRHQPDAPIYRIDWEPMILQVLTEISQGVPVGIISARFHHTLASVITEIAERMGEERVALTGGCFQNAFLTEQAVTRLQAKGFRPYWHQRVPPNDGGIALGQIFAVMRTEVAALRRDEKPDREDAP